MGSPLLSPRGGDSPLGPAPQLPMWGLQTPRSKAPVTPPAPKRWGNTQLLQQQDAAPELPAGEAPQLPCFTNKSLDKLCFGEARNSSDAELLLTPRTNRCVRTPQAPIKRRALSPFARANGTASPCGEAPPLPTVLRETSVMTQEEAFFSEPSRMPVQCSRSDDAPGCDLMSTPQSKVSTGMARAPSRQRASSPLMGSNRSMSSFGQAPLLPQYAAGSSKAECDGMTTPLSKSVRTPVAPKRWSGLPAGIATDERPALHEVPALPHFDASHECPSDMVQQAKDVSMCGSDGLALCSTVARWEPSTPVKGYVLLCPAAPTKHRELSPLVAWEQAPPLPTFMLEPCCLESCLEGSSADWASCANGSDGSSAVACN